MWSCSWFSVLRAGGWICLFCSVYHELHCELGTGLLVVDVAVSGLLADFPFTVGGVGGCGVVGHEAREDGARLPP